MEQKQFSWCPGCLVSRTLSRQRTRSLSGKPFWTALTPSHGQDGRQQQQAGQPSAHHQTRYPVPTVPNIKGDNFRFVQEVLMPVYYHVWIKKSWLVQVQYLSKWGEKYQIKKLILTGIVLMNSICFYNYFCSCFCNLEYNQWHIDKSLKNLTNSWLVVVKPTLV